MRHIGPTQLRCCVFRFRATSLSNEHQNRIYPNFFRSLEDGGLGKLFQNTKIPIIAKNITRDHYKSSKGKTEKGLRASFTLSSKLLNG
ncbi:hypothetical protein NC651_034140 [Populus alba x Populus x berolinensis]|nr:hypothetical protein NC651_034140 [Populus alba x Populus x berolinensis]